MRSNIFKAILGKSGIAASVLLLASGAALAQQQVNLTAGPATATQPDGTAVPMWGYSCGTVVSGSTATCSALRSSPGWSPVVITVPTGETLQINLTNSLPIVPTSLTIVGQLGGGLGSVGQRTTTPSPTHDPQGTTWPIANAPDPTGAINNPPPQGARVQSFATEVAAGATTTLPAWNSLRPGTYLIESGTHPSIQGPMGLYGVLVVTTAPAGTTAGTAYPGVSYNAEVPLLLSEIDPVHAEPGAGSGRR
jgi:FtsP/CotA-like multicopper oxidase with cupredoxin domain